MPTCYITQSNASKIIEGNDSKPYTGTEPLWDRPMFWFSFSQQNQLKAFRELLRDPMNYIKRVRPLAEVRDTLRYLRADQFPSYHTNRECNQLKAKFIGVVVPTDIQRRGPEKVQEFRNWVRDEFPTVFYTNKIENRVEFENAVMRRFKEEISQYRLDRDEYDNQGILTVSTLTKEEALAVLNDLLDRETTFYQQSPSWAHVINELGDKAYLAYQDAPLPYEAPRFSEDEVRKFLRFYQETFKTPIKNALKQYFQAAYNPEMSFTSEFLEQLHFRPCMLCNNSVFSIELNNQLG